MNTADELLKAILEADDEETIKDILGADYMEPPTEPEEGEVERFDRWADIRIGRDRHFCISYLTPVAYYESGAGVKLTDRYWSNATLRHIVKWTQHIGLGDFRRYSEIRDRYPTIPQEELLRLFRRYASQVRWTKRQVRKAEGVPYNKIITGLKGGREDRIDMNAPPPDED